MTMKAFGTQTLILLVLLATFITLSIPPIINQIRFNTTTTIIGMECLIDEDCKLIRCESGLSTCCINKRCVCCILPFKTTTSKIVTTIETHECEADSDCQERYWCYPPKNCMIGIQGISKCTPGGTCVKECNSDSDCDYDKICKELRYFIGDVGTSRKGCLQSNKHCEKDDDCINKCAGCFRKGSEPFNDCGAVPTGDCKCINSQCQRIYTTTTTMTGTECITEQDCIDFGKCDPGLECTCYQGKCYRGHVAGMTITTSTITTTTYIGISDPFILNNSIVLESKELVLKYGFSENYFDKHFSLVFFTDDFLSPSGARVIWQFEIGEYKAIIYDALGYYKDNKGTHIIHSIAPALTQQLPTVHDIENVIPKSEAERLMRSCIGEFKGAEAVLNLIGENLGLMYRASPVKDSAICPLPGSAAPCWIKYGIIDLESGRIVRCDK